MIYFDNYLIRNPDQIETPRLLVFKEKLENNIQRMAEYLNHIAPNSGMRMLCPHVKTNKSMWTTKKLMDAGVQHFKVTPNEVDMLVKTGARNIFVAYPLMLNVARKLAARVSANPSIQFTVQVGHFQHAELLRQAATEARIRWHYFLDLDVGMHRTGIQPDDAIALYQKISDWDEKLQFIGLHGYDGHIHTSDPMEKQKLVKVSMGKIVRCVKEFKDNEISISKIVVGGSPSFRHDLEFLMNETDINCDVQVSPGTWVYWDSKYDSLSPNQFEFAALILAQVMDLPCAEIATLNLGHKRWAADQGPPEIFSVKGMKALKWSEEHTVVSVPKGERLSIGDYVLIVPRHVCSTVNLWEFFTVIGSDGTIEIENCPIEGRNR